MAYFKRVVQGIDMQRPDGMRDRALLLLGRAGAFRRDELASLDLAPFRFDDDGLVVELPKSKTNQKGEAKEKAIFFASDRRSCPVRAVKDWLELLHQHRRTSVSLVPPRAAAESAPAEHEIVQLRLGAPYTAHSLRALATDLGVNKNTIAAAYKALLESGVVITDGRRGSVEARRYQELPTFWHPHLLARDLVALHDGNPDPTFLPTRPELLAAFAALDLAPPWLYGEAPNVLALLEWAHTAFAADGLSGAGIFVSGGALDALERALRTQLKPGDKVAVEDPGYFTVLALVRSLGLRPVPLVSDADGIQLASLASVLAGGCRAVVFSTRAQNPTGAVTSAQRAQELRPLAQQHPEVLFLDDDHSRRQARG